MIGILIPHKDFLLMIYNNDLELSTRSRSTFLLFEIQLQKCVLFFLVVWFLALLKNTTRYSQFHTTSNLAPIFGNYICLSAKFLKRNLYKHDILCHSFSLKKIMAIILSILQFILLRTTFYGCSGAHQSENVWLFAFHELIAQNVSKQCCVDLH